MSVGADVAAARSPAAQVVTALVESGEMLAVAESLTGGAVCSALVAVPGASSALRGGVVAYATELKADVLGVDPGLLRAHGPVHPDVAAAMAAGAARLMSAAWGLATTGVAGPTSPSGRPVGTVHLAVHGPMLAARTLQLPGDRDRIRADATAAALGLLLTVLLERARRPDGK